MKIKNCGKAKGNKKVALYNCDCLELMQQLPDQYFDLAVVDFPYGISTTNDCMNGRKANVEAKEKNMQWDIELLSDEYYEEVLRVSTQWIFWGGNWMPFLWKEPHKNVLVWDKKLGRGTTSFADCEIAVTNIDDGARIYARRSAIKDRWHPNQKPIKLYSWLLERYAQKEFKVFDPTMGSGSSAIASHFFGCEYVGCEREKSYFKRLVKRFKKETKQNTLFAGVGV